MEPIVTLRGVRRVQDKEQGGTEELEEVGGEVRKDKDHMRAIRMRLNRRHALVKLRSSCAMRTRAWEKLTCACYVHAVRCARSVHVLAHLVGYRGFLSSVNEICEPKKLKNPVQGNECNKMQNSYTIMVQYSRHRGHWRSPAGWAGTTLYMSRLRICRPARERGNSIISMHILESSPSSEVGCTSDCRTWELLKNVVVWVSQCRSSNLPQQQISPCLTMNFLPPLAADIPSSNLVKKQIDLKVSLHAGGVTVKTAEVQRPVHWCSTVDFELPRALCVLGLSDIENSCTVPLSFFPLPPRPWQHALKGLKKKNCFECILATGLSVLDSQHLFFFEILCVDIAKYYIQQLVFPVLDIRTLLAEVCVVQFCQDDSDHEFVAGQVVADFCTELCGNAPNMHKPWMSLVWVSMKIVLNFSSFWDTSPCQNGFSQTLSSSNTFHCFIGEWEVKISPTVCNTICFAWRFLMWIDASFISNFSKRLLP